MKRALVFLPAVLILLFNSVAAQEKAANNSSLKNRHSLGINMGMKVNSGKEISGDLVFVKMKSGFIGGIEYGYWFKDEWLAGINLSLVEANMDVDYRNVKMSSVYSILFGVKYYPESLKLGGAGRMYAGFFIGPVTGSGSKVSGIPAGTENIVETVVGGQAIIGADFFIARWLKLGPAVNYNFMSDFSEIVGEKKNFGGFGFVFNLGFVL